MEAEALKWISSILEEKQTPYMICGGLAAIAYGSSRPLNDIDIFVPDQYFQSVVDSGVEYVSKPAKRYKGYGWDLEYVQFIYKGTKIEVGNTKEAKMQSAATGEWVALHVDFSCPVNRVVLGCKVALMPEADLIGYKEVLGRQVDIEDIEAMKNRA